MGPLNKKLGEFWMENPWEAGANNLSAFERNRILMNRKGTGGSGRALFDVSHLTGADTDADSRAVVSGDFNSDGMPDLAVRSSGGGAVKIYLNRWPQQNWLQVVLKGTKSNTAGLGSRIKVDVGERTLWREVHRVASFRSQQPASTLIGLGASTTVKRITIEWPSGVTQELADIAANQRLVIEEPEGSDH